MNNKQAQEFYALQKKIEEWAKRTPAHIKMTDDGFVDALHNCTNSLKEYFATLPLDDLNAEQKYQQGKARTNTKEIAMEYKTVQKYGGIMDSTRTMTFDNRTRKYEKVLEILQDQIKEIAPPEPEQSANTDNKWKYSEIFKDLGANIKEGIKKALHIDEPEPEPTTEPTKDT